MDELFKKGASLVMKSLFAEINLFYIFPKQLPKYQNTVQFKYIVICY